MTTALLLDTNFSAAPLRMALQNLSMEVVVVGANPADALAKSGEGYIQADYSDVSVLADVIKDVVPDFIVPGCNDVSYESYCALPNQLTYTDHPSLVSTLHNKADFRAFCATRGIKAPISYDGDQSALADKVPLIVKPTDAFSGRGVTVLHERDPGALTEAIRAAQDCSRERKCIVEEFVSGQLYSYSVFLQEGAVYAGFLVREFSFSDPFSVDTSYVLRDSDLEARIGREVKKVIDALEIKQGLLHTQFILSGTDVYLIEVTRRCPGDLYAELIRFSTGFNYAEAYVASFVGRSLVSGNNDLGRMIVRHTMRSKESGYLGRLDVRKTAALMSMTPVLSVGEELPLEKKFRAAVGFFHADNEQELRDLLNDAERQELAVVHRI